MKYRLTDCLRPASAGSDVTHITSTLARRGGFTAATPNGRRSRRPHALQELLDLGLEVKALARQGLRRRQHVAGGLAGLAGALRGVADIDGDFRGPARRRANAVGDVLGRGALLLDGRRDRVGDPADALDGLADRL